MRDELHDLRTVSTLLHDLPALEPPRAFTLDPAQPQPQDNALWLWLRNVWRFEAAALAVVTGVVLMVAGVSVDAMTPSAAETDQALPVQESNAATAALPATPAPTQPASAAQAMEEAEAEEAVVANDVVGEEAPAAAGAPREAPPEQALEADAEPEAGAESEALEAGEMEEAAASPPLEAEAADAAPAAPADSSGAALSGSAEDEIATTADDAPDELDRTERLPLDSDTADPALPTPAAPATDPAAAPATIEGSHVLIGLGGLLLAFGLVRGGMLLWQTRNASGTGP
jgi:hypothetical protein